MHTSIHKHSYFNTVVSRFVQSHFLAWQYIYVQPSSFNPLVAFPRMLSSTPALHDSYSETFRICTSTPQQSFAYEILLYYKVSHYD